MELTLKYDCLIDKEIKDYLLKINGIEDIKINLDTGEIYIKYNNISIKLILMEVELFLDVVKFPSLIGFDKHSKNKLLDYEMIINDLCCECCLKINIDKLFETEGIESVGTDFDYDYINKKDVKIFIKYDNNKINIESIKKLENEFNK